MTSSNHYTKYLLACITNWLKLQSCSVLIHFVTNSFLIKRDLVNLYVWNTFFSLTLFKKLIQNWFLISFIASWYKFHICTISAHASSFLHLFQICFFDDNVFCISMNSVTNLSELIKASQRFSWDLVKIWSRFDSNLTQI